MIDLSPTMREAVFHGWARTSQTVGALLARGLLVERAMCDHEHGGFPLALSPDGQIVQAHLRRIVGHMEAERRHRIAAADALGKQPRRVLWLYAKANAHMSTVACHGRMDRIQARDMLRAWKEARP